MAVKTVTTYHCDRCGQELAKNDMGASITGDNTVITVEVNFKPYRDPRYRMDREKPRVIDWKMLCADCQLTVSMFFEPLRFQHASLSEGRTGRAFFQNLLGMTEEDSGQRASYVSSLMYRAMRLLGRKGPPTEEDPL